MLYSFVVREPVAHLLSPLDVFRKLDVVYTPAPRLPCRAQFLQGDCGPYRGLQVRRYTSGAVSRSSATLSLSPRGKTLIVRFATKFHMHRQGEPGMAASYHYCVAVKLDGDWYQVRHHDCDLPSGLAIVFGGCEGSRRLQSHLQANRGTSQQAQSSGTIRPSSGRTALYERVGASPRPRRRERASPHSSSSPISLRASRCGKAPGRARSRC